MENKSRTIKLMNDYGGNKIPFLFIIDFEMKNPIVEKIGEVAADKILFKVNEIKNFEAAPVISSKVNFQKYPVSYDEYLTAFNKVMNNINAGNTYLCNLTFPTRIETNYNLKALFLTSNAKYKLFYNDQFIVFSPECFVRIENGRIYSFPMKGTIDASIPNAKEIILKDEKELAEHITIVDLIRNDLSIVATDVVVESFRYVEEITTNQKNLLQVSSKISGILPDDYHSKIGNIIFSLLPAGSISGAPKKKTVEIIKEAETYQRGFYTGIFGIFDGTTLDSAVMIRFIEKVGNQYYFKSGGGITFMSDPESEYRELIDKVYVPII
ncbi:MAG: aminodeoxychorismate synthase component I [Ignavibacteria bacterium]|nr:aminodeoxychorismate synthase component I [Ignavibacteria bacterium]